MLVAAPAPSSVTTVATEFQPLPVGGSHCVGIGCTHDEIALSHADPGAEPVNRPTGTGARHRSGSRSFRESAPAPAPRGRRALES